MGSGFRQFFGGQIRKQRKPRMEIIFPKIGAGRGLCHSDDRGLLGLDDHLDHPPERHLDAVFLPELQIIF